MISPRQRLGALSIPLLFATISTALSRVLLAADSSVPSRGDDLQPGDKLILNSDAPIFRYQKTPGSLSPYDGNACAPYRTQLEVVTAPTTKTTTTTAPPGGAPTTVSSTDTPTTKVTTTAATAGETTSTIVQTVATATVMRVGPRFRASRAITKDAAGNTEVSCRDPASSSNPPAPLGNGYTTVIKGVTYEFTPSDLQKYSVQRYGFTYGALVVPTKVIIADRSFTTSSSVLPYVGYQGWFSGRTGAVIIGAGIGTAPASNQSSNTAGQSTRATFSAATGFIWSFGGGTFKGGILIGIDTAGSNTGYKYQGKPWIGISFGAGSQ